MQFNWHVLPGASICNIKKLFETYVKARILEESIKDDFFISMINDIDWTKSCNTETCVNAAKEVAAFATLLLFQARTLVLPGDRVRNTSWNANSNDPQGTCDTVALQMVDILKCHTSHTKKPTTKTNDRKNEQIATSKAHTRTIILAGTLQLCIYNFICLWCDTENVVLTPRRSEEKGHIDLGSE